MHGHTLATIYSETREIRGAPTCLGILSVFIEVLFYAWSGISSLIASVRRMRNFAVIFSSQYPRGVLLRSLCLKRLRPLIKAITAVMERCYFHHCCYDILCFIKYHSLSNNLINYLSWIHWIQQVKLQQPCWVCCSAQETWLWFPDWSRPCIMLCDGAQAFSTPIYKTCK